MQFFGKSVEYWAVFAGMALYVIARDAETESLSRRAMKTAISALLAIGFAPTLAPYLRDSETIATVAIMGFGLFTLDTVTALITDREFVKELVRRRFGGGGNSNDG